MRIRNAALALAGLGIVAIVIVRAWHGDDVKPLSVASTAPVQNKPVVKPKTPEVPAASAAADLEPASAATPLSTPTAPGQAKQAAAASLEAAKTPEPAPQAAVAETQVDNPQGTTDSPGDPLAQPENPSEQFMHSRRGDGQHSE